MSEYLLGLDIGTTATKGILLHPEQGIVAEAEAPATLCSPRPGWAEANPAEWWSNVCQVSQTCIAQAQIRPDDIVGVAAGGMVPALILLDEDGELLYPSIQQNDARAFQEIEDIRARVDEKDIMLRTGSAITQQSIGPKLLWLRRHHPEVMDRTAFLMGSYDYVAYRLTGKHSCERNWALESGLYDLCRQAWDPGMLELSTAGRHWLGRVSWPGELVGEVTGEAAAHSGLAPGTPVVAGSADHVASAFSAGLKSPGDLLVKLGGAGDILYCLDERMVDGRLFLDYHVIPGKYLLNGCMAASGSIIKWFHQNFAPGSSLDELDAEAAVLPPGADKLVLLPYFSGEKTPLNDPLARGVVFGLALSHTRGHVYRSILEGIAYGFRHHLEVLAELGLPVTQARVTNGGARSQLWKQITADVLGMPLMQVAKHPGSSLGAAFVAGMGVGSFSHWSQVGRFIQIADVVEPNESARQRYQELFEIYRRLYDSLQDQYVALHQVQ